MRHLVFQPLVLEESSCRNQIRRNNCHEIESRLRWADTTPRSSCYNAFRDRKPLSLVSILAPQILIVDGPESSQAGAVSHDCETNASPLGKPTMLRVIHHPLIFELTHTKFTTYRRVQAAYLTSP